MIMLSKLDYTVKAKVSYQYADIIVNLDVYITY